MSWLRGVVKEVTSGDSVVIVAGGALSSLAVPAEKRLTLSSLTAPRLGKRDGSTRDEPFAFESREFLRKKLVGKPCVFKVDYVIEAAGNKEFGSVFLEGEGGAKENVAVSVVAAGWAKVREQQGGGGGGGQQQQKQSPFLEELLKAQEAAQAAHAGQWTKDPSAIAAGSAQPPPAAGVSAMSLLSSVGKGKPVAGVVEAVLNGSTLRLSLVPERTPVTVSVAGVQCPSIGRRPPPPPAPAADKPAAAAEANGGGAEANGDAKPPAAKPAVTAASIAAAAGAGQQGGGGPEPLAREAKWFSEARALQREARVVLEGVDKYNNLFGSVYLPDPSGDATKPPLNLGEALVSAGLAKTAEWGLTMMTTGGMRLREAERAAKQAKKGIWVNYVPAPTGQTKLSDSFVGRVVEVVSGDTLVVKDPNANGAERRLSLSSVRAPRAGGRDRAPEPHGLEARDFLRKRLIGKEVTVKMEYTRRVGGGGPGAGGEGGGGGGAAAGPAFEMAFGNVEVNGAKEGEVANAAEMVVARGFGAVVRHRSDEERSGVYESLLDLEEKAKQAKRGIHSAKEAPVPRINDVSGAGNAARARTHLPFLQRAGKLPALVESVISGHRLRVHIPKEGVTVAMAPSGIRAPQRAMAASGGRPAAPGEPHGEAAYAWTREHFNQREVEIEVEAADKGGTFLGSVVLPGPKPLNLGVSLARLGLAKPQPFFSPDRVRGGAELAAAIQQAKEARRGVWEGWSPEDDAPPADDDGGAAGNGADADAADADAAAKGPTKVFTVTEVVDGTEFFVRDAAEPRVQWVEEQLRGLSLDDAPGATGLVQGSLCLARFSADNNWYRAYVERAHPAEPRYEVFFVDFGNRERVPTERARAIDAALAAVPPQAVPAQLAYVRVPGLEAELGADAAAYLAQLVGSGKRLSATVVRRERGVPKDKHPRRAADKLHLLLKEEGADGADVVKEMLTAGMARLPAMRRVRDDRLRAALEALQPYQEEARKAHRGMFEFGDPADSDDEDAPRPAAGAWGKKR